MAEAILYKTPAEERQYIADFQDLLRTSDTALLDIGAGSDVSAVDSAGVDASATVLGTETRSGKTLTVVLKAGTDGEDYIITFKGKGTASNDIHELKVHLRVRSKISAGGL